MRKTSTSAVVNLVFNAVVLLTLTFGAAIAIDRWDSSLPPTWHSSSGPQRGAYQGVASFPSSNIPGLRPLLGHIAGRNLVATFFALAAFQVLTLVLLKWNRAPSVAFLALSQVLILVGALACTELQMRVVLEPLRGKEYMYPDPVRHWRYNPACDDGSYVADRNGMRGLEAPAEKLPNEFRILVLGDSISAGSDLAETKTYPWLLRAYLQKRFPNLLIRVKNGAANGYSIYQNISVIKTISDSYKPDLIVCEFTHANHEIVQLYESGLYRWRLFQEIRKLLFQSDLYLWARREINGRPEDVSHEQGRRVLGNLSSDADLIVNGLQNVQEYAQRNHVQLVFYIPYVYGNDQDHAGVMDKTIRTFAEQRNLPFIDLNRKWSRVPNIEYLLQDRVHANIPGSEMQAHDIADFLIAKGLIPGTSADPRVTPTGTPYPYPNPTPYPVPDGTRRLVLPPPLD